MAKNHVLDLHNLSAFESGAEERVLSEQCSLDSVPVEVIRRIVANGPFDSALSMLLVSRTLYNTCNDWTVFKGIIECDGNGSGWRPDLSKWKSIENTKSYWQTWAYADFLAVRALKFPETLGDDSPYAAASWVPHLIAMNHPLFSLSHIKHLARAVGHLHYAPDDLAVAFSIAACSMSADLDFDNDTTQIRFYTGLRGQDEDSDILNSFSKDLINTGFPNGIFTSMGYIHDPRASPRGILCTAYRAISPLCYEIRLAVTQRRFSQFRYLRAKLSAPKTLPLPPFPSMIPFQAFMAVPTPLSMDSMDTFNSSHLPLICTPEFIEDGTWTGYSCLRARRNLTSSNPVGYTSFELPILGLKFETKINSRDTNILDLFSNDGHLSYNDIFYFQGHLWKDTGILSMRMHGVNVLSIPWIGILTPLGIVLQLPAQDSGVWIWLWKSEWSVGRSVEWEPLSMEDYSETLRRTDPQDPLYHQMAD